MNNILFYIKKSFSIFYQNRAFIFPSLFILLLVINLSLYSLINLNDFFISKSLPNTSNSKSQPHFLRLLNQFSSSTKINNEQNNDMLSLNLLESVNSNIKELGKYYEFVQNITKHNYYGKWENFNIDKNFFIDNNGVVDLSIQKKRSENYLFNLNQKNNSNITVSFIIKDGRYIDNYIIGNFSFNFKDVPLISNLNKNNFSIILTNVTLAYAYGHYMDIGKKRFINNTNINMTFYKKPAIFQNKLSHYASSTDYSIIDFHIKSMPIKENEKDSKNKNNKNEAKNFEISFTSSAYGLQKYPTNILNYSILLTFAAFIEIYFSTKLLMIVNENVQMALNIDLYTIFMQIMWTALICGTNFFLSLTYESLTYEYGMPSMIYFALFSIFLLRILFIGWKSRYMDLLFNDMQQFRKKLFRFYLIFYCLLFCTLISIKLWYTYFIFTFFLFASTWIFQIYYSAKNGTKPPMPYSYIFIISLFKMLIPIYLKVYSNNIFSLRPSYFKVFLCTSIVFIESVIVSLQKLLGPKFFIPLSYRQQTFDYYKSAEEIHENLEETECVICLDNLNNLRVNMEEDEDFNIKEGNYIEKIAMMIQKWNKKKNLKPYMRTPCGHLFHTKCLETWLEVKNECPYCRQKIPPLDL